MLIKCVLQENKGPTSKQKYKANVYVEGDKNCQVNRWPVKPAKESSHMWSVRRDQKCYNLVTSNTFKKNVQ